MLQTVVLMDFEMDEDRFIVVRSTEALEAELLNLIPESCIKIFGEKNAW